jgi:protein involved in polysaccharide export with SLBB domain
MKKTFLFLLLFSGFLNAFAQNISPKLKSLLDQLPPAQRNIVLSEYQNAVSSALSNKNTISSSAKPRDESLITSTFNARPAGNDLSPSKRETQLLALVELESMIRQDIELNQADLQVLVKRGQYDPSSASDKAFVLDRIHDLKQALGNIRTLQFDIIKEQTRGFDVKKDPDLLPYGYNVFNIPNSRKGHEDYLRSDNNFAIPSDYKIGSGDLLEIQLYGQEEAQYSLTIGRNGILQLPRVGPLNILEKGNSFQALKSLINEKVKEKLGEGVGVSVTLGELRQIKVFLAGEFKQPGLKIITAGSSVFNLLLKCGGINEISSLRSLALRREGMPVQTIDLYDLLLKGERSSAILEDGDVIFLPTVKNRVWIGGEAMRPAIYETTNRATLSDVIELSGGFSDRAMTSSISLQRVSDQGDYVSLKSLDFNKDAEFLVSNGDRIEIFPVSDSSMKAITLEGEVELAKKYEWRKGVRISDIIKSKSAYTAQADLNYALIRRENSQGKMSILSFSPNRVLFEPGSDEDLVLLPMDKLIILSSTESNKRERVIRPLLEELRYEGLPGQGVPSVRILGMVHFPGNYPFATNMTISDLLVAGGGMTGAAYTMSSELSRQSVDLNSSSSSATITHFSLDSLLSNKTLAMKLRAKDIFSVKPIPSWSESNIIEILGEVRFPGSYTFQRNETLKSVFERAGGFTTSAFPKGAVFTRKNLIEREEEQKERLIAQLETDLANISLSAGSGETAAKAKSVADSLLSRLKGSKSTGRLVLNLNEQVSPKNESSIVVRDGDRLFIPSIPYEISVMGEVQFATSHLFNEKLNLKDYIQRSGGYTANADISRAFAVKADGSVLTRGNSTTWFKSSNSRENLEPGDVIVVPINLEKGKWMETLTSSTQIVYQLAVAAAAVNSF